eukprot:8474263-Ditylum_brightwellii.AAC.1
MIRFQAYACVKSFSTALKMSSNLPDTEEDIVSLDSTQPAEKKMIAAGKRNVLVMAHLTMALGMETLLNM